MLCTDKWGHKEGQGEKAIGGGDNLSLVLKYEQGLARKRRRMERTLKIEEAECGRVPICEKAHRSLDYCLRSGYDGRWSRKCRLRVWIFLPVMMGRCWSVFRSRSNLIRFVLERSLLTVWTVSWELRLEIEAFAIENRESELKQWRWTVEMRDTLKAES